MIPILVAARLLQSYVLLYYDTNYVMCPSFSFVVIPEDTYLPPEDTYLPAEDTYLPAECNQKIGREFQYIHQT